MSTEALPAVAQAAVRYWWVFMVQALIAIAIGCLLVFKPDKSISFVAILLGIYLVLWGLIQLMTAITIAGERLLHLGLGLLGVIAGAVVVTSPDNSVNLVVVLVGIYLILWGLYALLAMFGDRPDKGTRVLAGLISAAAGIVIIAWPGPSATVVAVVLGIWLIVTGLLEAGGALRLRSLGRV